MKNIFQSNPNPLVAFLGKKASEFTAKDLILYVQEHEIKMLNFHYVADDGRIKTLNFVIHSLEHLQELLHSGERVDGSSLFSHIEAGNSDLYVVPRYRTAFLNPFSVIPSLDLLCSFFTKEGLPLESGPDYVLHKANQVLHERTGYDFHAMGELEFYIISEKSDLYLANDQKGYHESAPFNQTERFRVEAMDLIARCGGYMKYGHSEVGNFALGDKIYEQHEIEFLPVPVEEAGDQLVIAKWLIRQLAAEYDLSITFAPKITVGKAGSGLHVHTKIMKGADNVMVKDGVLSDVAKRIIAGYVDLAAPISAFGNTNPSSYFRLVPHQEAPTTICWGDRNRSTLVRVPLGWTGNADMAKLVNPLEESNDKDYSYKQTVEYRAADGSANVYLLLAGLTLAALHGLEMEDALEKAKESYVDINIFDDDSMNSKLASLPLSCYQSAQALADRKQAFLKYNVFTEALLDDIVEQLKKFNDENLRKEVDSDKDRLLAEVNKYFHCG